MNEDDLTDDESRVLDLAGDMSGAFTLLASLNPGERHPERAAVAVESLLDRGLVEIEEHRAWEPRRSVKRPRAIHLLDHDDAVRAIRDPRKWRDPEIEPFLGDETYYEARATDKGIAVLRSRGWMPS